MKKSCDDGDSISVHIAHLYYYGQCVKQNHTEAAIIYEKAFKDNNVFANVISCANLGVLYIKGQGVKTNKSTAKKYVEKSFRLEYQNACQAYQ